jgi:hypothetical protein
VAALLDFVVVESDGCYRSLPAEFGHVIQNLRCARTALCTEERHLFEIFFVRSYVEVSPDPGPIAKVLNTFDVGPARGSDCLGNFPRVTGPGKVDD